MYLVGTTGARCIFSSRATKPFGQAQNELFGPFAIFAYFLTFAPLVLALSCLDTSKNHKEVHIFDLQTFSWSVVDVKGTHPFPRNGHTATVADNKIFIIGGWLGVGPHAAQDMHCLDLATVSFPSPIDT